MSELLMAKGVTFAGRPVWPFSLLAMLSGFVLFVDSFFSSDGDDALHPFAHYYHVVGLCSGLSAILLAYAWWRVSSRIAAWAMLVVIWTWTTRAAFVYFSDTSSGWRTICLDLSMVVGAAAAYWVHRVEMSGGHDG